MVSSSVFLLKDVVFTFVALKLHIPQVISGRVTKVTERGVYAVQLETVNIS